MRFLPVIAQIVNASLFSSLDKVCFFDAFAHVMMGAQCPIMRRSVDSMALTAEVFATFDGF